MTVIFTIIQYFILGAVDVTDKFLISVRKIEAVSYTFWTVVTGALLLVVWPWIFLNLTTVSILLNLLSGAFFSLAMYVFYKVLSEGEVSRVIPFVFGLVPVFDIIIGLVTGRNVLSVWEFAAVCLLVPGALLISHTPGSFNSRHILLKTFSAFLFSAYYALWQFGATSSRIAAAAGHINTGSIPLNALMWNRLGAALVLVILLVLPKFRKKVFRHKHIKEKHQTSGLFLGKQFVGGANFVFYSWLLSVGKIPVINALQGFRYAFVLGISFILSKKYRKILNEKIDRNAMRLKIVALAFIFIGTLVLFLGNS